MPERPRFSRFRRIPGLYRFGDAKPPDLDAEPQLLALYLPAGLLDRAEALAMRAGIESVQAFCSDLLRAAIESEEEEDRMEAQDARRAPLESLDALASDPDYVAAVADRARKPVEPPVSDPARGGIAPAPGGEFPRDAILRHAGLGPEFDLRGFLPTLRRGEPIAAEVADPVMAALAELEGSLRDAEGLDRRLAYALHRLAFEGQVLLTDAPTQAAADPATVRFLRRIQEGVDRILSGEDIRYYPEPDGPADPNREARP